MLSKELEYSGSKLAFESGRPGLDGLQDMLERADAAERLEEGGPRPHPQGGIRAQPLPDRRQAERAAIVLLEYVQRCEEAKHPVQGGLIGAGALGQLPCANRTIGE